MAIRLLHARSMLDARLSFARRRVAALSCALVLALPGLTAAQTVTAMWDFSPATDHVTSYQVCVGPAPGNCSQQLANVSATQNSLTFSPTPGVLEHVTVRAVNGSGAGAYSTEVVFSIPGFAAPSNRTSQVNTAISPLQLSVSDPDGSALTYSHTGLPIGLSLSQTGRISGTPTAPGTYNVTIFVDDGLVTVSRSFVWTVVAASSDTTPPSITITSHTSGQIVTSPTVTLAGTASDAGNGGHGVALVDVNGVAASGGTASGNGTANWSRTITLVNGSNTITVEAQDGVGNIQMMQLTLKLGAQANSQVSSGPVSITGLTSNLSSPQAPGTAVTFTARATGGTGSYQFKWWVYDGSAWTLVQNWGSATFTWRPTTAGSGYRVGIWARDATSTVDSNAINLSVPFPISGGASAPPPTTSGGASSNSNSSSGPSGGPVSITGLTSSLSSPQSTGTAITFTAGAAGGTGAYQFKWWVYDGSAWTMAQNWGSATFTWRPTTAGSGYRVGIWARDATSTVNSSALNLSVPFPISGAPAAPATSGGGTTSSNGGPVSITGLVSNLSSPQSPGTAIKFTAGATGGTGSYQFKWWVYDGSAWTMVQNWGSATFTWRPTTAGSGYRVGIWARDATSTVNSGAINLSVPFVITGATSSSSSGSSSPSSSALHIVALTSSVPSLPAGSAVTFAASAAGGSGTVQYKWWLYDGSTWVDLSGWMYRSTFTWQPQTPNANYRIGVWVRDSSNWSNPGNVNLSIPFLVTP